MIKIIGFYKGALRAIEAILTVTMNLNSIG